MAGQNRAATTTAQAVRVHPTEIAHAAVVVIAVQALDRITAPTEPMPVRTPGAIREPIRRPAIALNDLPKGRRTRIAIHKETILNNDVCHVMTPTQAGVGLGDGASRTPSSERGRLRRMVRHEDPAPNRIR